MSIFPNNVPIQPHEILQFVPTSHEYPFLKCISNVAILPTMCSWQTHGFHVLITLWQLFPDRHIYWPLSVGSVLSVCHKSIKWFIMKTSYFLPRAKFLPGTYFMNRSYLLPCENFKLPYLPSEARQYLYPNWDLVKSILYSKNYTISCTGTLRIWPLFVPFDPAATAPRRM